MPDFEQNWGTNLKLKSASRSGTEISEILDNGSTQHISKHCSTSHFLWLLVTDVTPHFGSFLTELGHKI